MSSKRDKDLPVKVEPSFLTQYAEQDTSLEGMGEYRVLSRARVVQGLSPAPLKEAAGEGGVVLTPGNQVVISLNEAFLFVPIYQYTEFVKWADRRDKDADSPIVEKTMNRTGELARRARDFDDRFEQYDGGPKNKPFMYHYVEHINFVGIIYGDHELAGTPIGISFAKGEIGNGKGFCSAIMMRKVPGPNGTRVQAPLWSTVWRFATSARDKDGYTWYGYDFSNPEEPFINESDAEGFLELHTEMKELIENARAGLDYGDEVDGDEVDDDEGM